MNEDAKKKIWDKLGGNWGILGAMGGLLMAPWALWALGKNRKNQDPLIEALDRQRASDEKINHAKDLAAWANERAGAHLELALGLSPAQGQEAFLKSAILYATCAAGARQSASDHGAARSEAEDVWLAEAGIEVPAWSRPWVFGKTHLHEAQHDETLFAKLVEVFSDIEEKVRPEAEKRGLHAKRSLHDEVGGWKVDFSAGRSFGDLTEEERAEVLRARCDWKVVDILSSRWTKVPPPEPAAAPAAEPPTDP